MRVESLVFAAAALLTACDADRVQRPHHDAAPGFNRAPAPYVVTDLGLAGSAYAINDGQEIVGDIASSGGTRAFRRLWNGQVDKLANLGKNGSSHANDISARGAIAGWSTHGPGLFLRPCCGLARSPSNR